MDVAGVRAALGMAPVSVVVGNIQLNCTPYTPTSVSVPCFYPGEVDLDYASGKGTFNRQPVVEITCYLLVAPESNDQAGQALLDEYLTETGASSIKAALESDQTLGGVCKSVFAHNVDGYRLYTVGLVAYYGARFRVQVLGG